MGTWDGNCSDCDFEEFTSVAADTVLSLISLHTNNEHGNSADNVTVNTVVRDFNPDIFTD